MPRSSSRRTKVRNALSVCVYKKKDAVAKNDRIVVAMAGGTNEVVALKQALSEAENKAARECTEREKQEARVGEV